MVYLKYLPLGFWVRMEEYSSAPFQDALHDIDDSLTGDLTGPLVFIESRTSEPFTFRGFTVTRTGFPFSHGRAIATVACQGRTMRQGCRAREHRSRADYSCTSLARECYGQLCFSAIGKISRCGLGSRPFGERLSGLTSPRGDPGLRAARGRERQGG